MALFKHSLKVITQDFGIITTHTQGADSLRLGDFGRGWRYLVEVGVSKKRTQQVWTQFSLNLALFSPLASLGPGFVL